MGNVGNEVETGGEEEEEVVAKTESERLDLGTLQPGVWTPGRKSPLYWCCSSLSQRLLPGKAAVTCTFFFFTRQGFVG